MSAEHSCKLWFLALRVHRKRGHSQRLAKTIAQWRAFNRAPPSLDSVLQSSRISLCSIPRPPWLLGQAINHARRFEELDLQRHRCVVFSLGCSVSKYPQTRGPQADRKITGAADISSSRNFLSSPQLSFLSITHHSAPSLNHGGLSANSRSGQLSPKQRKLSREFWRNFDPTMEGVHRFWAGQSTNVGMLLLYWPS